MNINNNLQLWKFVYIIYDKKKGKNFNFYYNNKHLFINKYFSS